jgi:alpha-glucosidase
VNGSIRSSLHIVAILALLTVLVGSPALKSQAAGVQRVKFTSGSSYLIVEVLDDDLVHFEISGQGPGPDTTAALFSTPMIAKTGYAGPASFTQSGSTLETAELRVAVDSASLCVTMTDKTKAQALTTICPHDLAAATKGLTLTPGAMQNVYGLGAQFFNTADGANGDWVGRSRTSGSSYGNVMSGDGAAGGAVGNVQVPVLYAVGPNSLNYGLFVDHVYKQQWNFVSSPWRLDTTGDQIRWYFMGGPNLPDLRQDYLELTGRPPVPPKQAFGLWVSEYGYDNWAELEGKLATLRSNAFPIDGFVLDLQWFGGINSTDNTRMGTLSWDLSKFPDPAAKLAAYRANEGLGIIPIEESYIGKGLAEHADLQSRGYLVRQADGATPVYLTGNPWWGKGGMIDWTNDAAGDYWHDTKRAPLIRDGVIGHWIDLGEPEMFDATDWTAGVLTGKHDHAAYHNVYNLKWAESIARGYARTSPTKRPFMLARSGAAGIQRFGAALWSGDIGSDIRNIPLQQNAQMHMSLSGIDYYGSDIGGFHRSGDVSVSYTQWLATSVWTDVPVRPHVNNLCGCNETAPDRVGDTAANRANLRQRYELTPYYYSLAHRAYRYGEPIVPPLVYYYQNDPNVRELGSQKLIGRDLLVATASGSGVTQTGVYLPAGDWVDYYTNTWLSSAGQTFAGQPTVRDGKFQLPAYARAGAIIPKMYVDDKTMNVLGKRTDGSAHTELIARVYAAPAASSFTLYEDDGETTGYQSGAVRTTDISQQLSGSAATVTVAASAGTYAGAPSTRDNVVELVANGSNATAVSMNGAALTQHGSRAAFDAAASGWYKAGANLVIAKSGPQSVSSAKTFVFTLGGSNPTATPITPTATPTPPPGTLPVSFSVGSVTVGANESVYVVGNASALAGWDTAQAIPLIRSGGGIWSGTVFLPASASIEYKYIKKDSAGAVTWEPNGNRIFAMPASGSVTRNDSWGTLATPTPGGPSPTPTYTPTPTRTPTSTPTPTRTSTSTPTPTPGGPSPTPTHTPTPTRTPTSTPTPSASSVTFICDNGTTVLGQSVYVVGNIAQLGSWAPQSAIKLDPNGPYPRWTGLISGLPLNTAIEWKCIKRWETGDTSTVIQWEPGANNTFTTTPGFSGPVYGAF